MVAALFTNRVGGVSRAPYNGNNLAGHVGDDPLAVAENRRQLAQLVRPVQFMNQTHGDVIALVDSYSTHAPNADALVTTEEGIALGVLVADCVPLLLWNEDVVGAVHVGRRGLMNDIAVSTVQLMASLGNGHIQGALGPSICGRCYEVGEDVYEEVVAKFPMARATTRTSTLSLDLPLALSETLHGHGVEITRSETCTCENPNFFSYRRDGRTGRQAGVIWR